MLNLKTCSKSRKSLLYHKGNLNFTFYIEQRRILTVNILPRGYLICLQYGPRSQKSCLPLLFTVRMNDQCKSSGRKAACRTLMKLTLAAHFFVLVSEKNEGKVQNWSLPSKLLLRIQPAQDFTHEVSTQTVKEEKRQIDKTQKKGRNWMKKGIEARKRGCLVTKVLSAGLLCFFFVCLFIFLSSFLPLFVSFFFQLFLLFFLLLFFSFHHIFLSRYISRSSILFSI